jgi:RNA polymerase sigma-70 factor, ECF subfamily
VVAVTDETGMHDARVRPRLALQVVEDVHERYGQPLWGFARRLGLDDDEAADVVQEALLRLLRAFDGGEAVERPAAWAFRTAYRLAMDRHRLRRRWQALLERAARTGIETAHDTDALLAVWTEVDRLPERQRQVLYLRYRADLPFDDIGEVLGIDASSARGNASRGIAALRERLAERDD